MTQDEIRQNIEVLLQSPEFANQSSELVSAILDWMIVGAMYIQPILEKEFIDKAKDWLEKELCTDDSGCLAEWEKVEQLDNRLFIDAFVKAMEK